MVYILDRSYYFYYRIGWSVSNFHSSILLCIKCWVIVQIYQRLFFRPSNSTNFYVHIQIARILIIYSTGNFDQVWFLYNQMRGFVIFNFGLRAQSLSSKSNVKKMGSTNHTFILAIFGFVHDTKVVSIGQFWFYFVSFL